MGAADDCAHERMDYVTERELRCMLCLLIIRPASGLCMRCLRPFDDHALMLPATPECPPAKAAP